MTRADRDSVLEEAAVCAEQQNRVGREWVRDSLWDAIIRRVPDAIRRLKSVTSAVAPAATTHESKPTEISVRLRRCAEGHYDGALTYAKLLNDAADEIERYYGAMLAWKQTAEKKDRDWNAERSARVDDRIKARAAGRTAGQGMSNEALAAWLAQDICTCPSGDGSLRWPCPNHPPIFAIAPRAGKTGGGNHA